MYRSQFRLPWELYERLKAVSEASGRSLNAEIVARLEASFHQEVLGLKTGELIDALLDRFPSGQIEVRIGKLDENDEQE